MTWTTRARIASVIVAAVATHASQARAQSGEVSLGGGVSAPLSPSAFTSGWNTGFNVGFYGGVDLGKAARLGLNFGYHRFALNEGYLQRSVPGGSSVSIDGGALSVFDPMLALKVHLPADHRLLLPYGLAGVGILIKTVSDATIKGPGGEKKVSFNGDTEGAFTFGGGVQVMAFENMGFFVEARIVLGLSGDSTKFVPVTAGVTF